MKNISIGMNKATAILMNGNLSLSTHLIKKQSNEDEDASTYAPTDLVIVIGKSSDVLNLSLISMVFWIIPID